MARRYRRIFPRYGLGRRAGNGLSDPGFAYSDYWLLTVTPQATKPRRSKPLMITVGALIALSAVLTFAFRHGIPAW
jgi:hypothetical protein